MHVTHVPALLLALSLVVLRGAEAKAQSSYAPYPIGSRSAGMAGAYTALSDDGSGAYFNPAGPAFAESESVSVSASIYGWINGSYENALGNGVNFEHSNFNMVPTSVSTLLQFGPRRQRTDPAPLAFTFNFFTPGTYDIGSRASANMNTSVYFRSTSEKYLVAGPGLAWRITDRIAVGLSLFLNIHTRQQRYDLTDIYPTMMPGLSDLIQLTGTIEETNVGVQPVFGARFEPVRNLLIGVSARLPSFQFFGQGEAFGRFVVVDSAASAGASIRTNVDESVVTRRILPARFNLGVAWRVPRRVAISAEGNLYVPLAYRSIESTGVPELNENVSQNLVVNAALGFEIYPVANTMIRFGGYTDFAATPYPVAPAAMPGPDEPDLFDHQHLFGGVVQVGRMFGDAETNLGVNVAAGPGRFVGYDLGMSTFRTIVVDGTQWRLFLVYSGSFSF